MRAPRPYLQLPLVLYHSLRRQGPPPLSEKSPGLSDHGPTWTLAGRPLPSHGLGCEGNRVSKRADNHASAGPKVTAPWAAYTDSKETETANNPQI